MVMRMEPVIVRMPPALVEDVDAWARRTRRTRAQALRDLLNLGLRVDARALEPLKLAGKAA
jgi:hypothetical protein